MKINPRTFEYIADRFDQRAFPANEIVFHEGETGSTMYVTVEGELQVTLHNNLLDTLSDGDIFGEMSLVSNIPRSGTVTTSTNCLLIPIEKTQFTMLLAEYPDFGTQVMSVMANRLRHWMEEEVNHQRIEEELAIGQRIQLSLLPANTPDLPGWQFAAYYRAARQVGGDFYDFIKTPGDPNRQNIVIADVSGKGVPAALFMAVARTMIRGETRNGRNPAAVLQRTNELIQSDNCSPLFLSALHASLNTSTGQMIFASAGHESPLLLHHNTGAVEELKVSGLVLGAFTSVSYEEETVTLDLGDVVIFYTDGVTEARNAQGQFYDDKRLEAALADAHDLTAAEIVGKLVESVTSFTGSAPQTDDLTAVVIKRTVSGG